MSDSTQLIGPIISGSISLIILGFLIAWISLRRNEIYGLFGNSRFIIFLIIFIINIGISIGFSYSNINFLFENKEKLPVFQKIILFVVFGSLVLVILILLIPIVIYFINKTTGVNLIRVFNLPNLPNFFGFLNLPKIIIVSLILGLLVLIIGMILLVVYKYNIDNEKEEKYNKKMSERRSTLIGDIVIGLTSSIMIVLLILSIFKFDNIAIKVFSVLFIIVLIIGAIVWYLSSKDNSDDIKDSNLDIKYPEPTSRKLKLKELKKLLKKLGDFKMDNECKIDDQSDCNYLYKQYIASGGDEKVLDELLDQLASMKNKNGEEDNTGLINQAIFIIYQLLQCKIELDDKETIYKFGTWAWWKKNIFMSDNNKDPIDPMQRYIYFISILVGILFLFVNLYQYGINVETIFGIDGKQIFTIDWLLRAIAIFGTLTYMGLISWSVMYNLLSSPDSVEVDKPVSKEYQRYISDYTTDPTTQKEKTGLISLFGGWISAIIVSGILSYMGGESPFGVLNKINAIAIIMAFVIIFNGYYIWLMPQLFIIGVLIQKYILSTDMFDNPLSMIVKGIIVVAVIFASFYDTTYKPENVEKDDKKYKGFASTYNKPVWYIFGILMFLILQNGVESFIGETGNYGENNWSLILVPAVRYIISIIIRTDVSYDVLSISNNM